MPKNSQKVFKLTKEAVQAIREDDELYVKTCSLLDVNPTSLYSMLNRNSQVLTVWHIVELVAEKLGKQPSQILIR